MSMPSAARALLLAACALLVAAAPMALVPEAAAETVGPACLPSGFCASVCVSAGDCGSHVACVAVGSCSGSSFCFATQCWGSTGCVSVGPCSDAAPYCVSATDCGRDIGWEALAVRADPHGAQVQLCLYEYGYPFVPALDRCDGVRAQPAGTGVQTDRCTGNNGYGGTCERTEVQADGSPQARTCTNDYYGFFDEHWWDPHPWSCSTAASADATHACAAGACQQYGRTLCSEPAGCGGNAVCVSQGGVCKANELCVSLGTCAEGAVCVSVGTCSNASKACVSLGECDCRFMFYPSCTTDETTAACVSVGACYQRTERCAPSPIDFCTRGVCVSLTWCRETGVAANPNTGHVQAHACSPRVGSYVCQDPTADLDAADGHATLTECLPLSLVGCAPISFDLPTLTVCYGPVCVGQAGLMGLVLDTDQDGHSTLDEAQANADPTNPDSRPDTDDDCDGKANAAEHDILLAMGIGHPFLTHDGGGVEIDPNTPSGTVTPPSVGFDNEGSSTC